MNENINLVEILKDAPKGTKLWSPLCGECSLNGVDMSSDVPICVEVKGDENNHDCVLFFAANGKYFSRFASAECLLFPSENNRDWETFKAPWKHKHFEPFQKVLCVADNSHDCEVWSADLYSHYDESTREHYLVSGFVKANDEVIPYEGNEEKLGKRVK